MVEGLGVRDGCGVCVGVAVLVDVAVGMGSPILGNMIMIGALLHLGLFPLRPEEFRETLARNFRDQRLETNLQALQEGERIIRPFL